MYIENDPVQIYVKDKHEIKHYRCLEKEVDRDGCEILSLEQHDAELLKDFATVLANRWQLNVDVDFDHEIELRCELEKLLK